jgi:hypothetical protein
MTSRSKQLTKKAEWLYQRYGLPLETEHSGEYVAISPDGGVVLGDSAFDVATKAKASLGPGAFVFKLGELAVGKWR